MSERACLVLIGMLCSHIVMGQNVIRGHVRNASSLAVDGAQVVLLKAADSTLVATALSDTEGWYSFENVREGSYIVMASFFGENPVSKKVMLWNKVETTVDFTIKGTMLLDEAKVVFDGIHVNGDTTSYSVKHFATGSERNLRGILERLPNVRVDIASGTVMANGSYVNRILIEEQDLFQGNRAIPLNYLSSDGIKTVEVIDNYSEYDIYSGFRTTDETVINLKMDEKAKNRLKGSMEVSGGMVNRYHMRNTALYIGRKSMFSGIVALNNVGERLLRFQDIVQFNGGYGSVLAGGDPVNGTMKLMETYAAFMDNRKDIMRRESNLVALNYAASPSKRISVSLNGIYGFEKSASRSEHSYMYLSGFQYGDTLREDNRNHQLLLNAKIHCAISQDFHVTYNGNLLYADRNMESVNSMAALSMASGDNPSTMDGRNHLNFVKRIGGNSLNLSMEHQTRISDRKSHFSSEGLYYVPELKLSHAYDYTSSEQNHVYVAHLFYLHRLREKWYMRFDLQGARDQHRFDAKLFQEADTGNFDNDAVVRYTEGHADILLGKDSGRFTFDARLRYVLLHASSNIPRDFERNRQEAVLPRIKFKFQFAPTHHLSLDYVSDIKKQPVTNLLENGWLKKYNQVSVGGLDRFFYKTNTVALSHVLMLQYTGLSFINMLSYERTADGATDNISLLGYVNVFEKTIVPYSDMFSGMSTIEYRLLAMPLNIRMNASYRRGFTPFYNAGVRYDARLNNLMSSLQLTTHYKTGFNGKLQWNMSHSYYEGIPVERKMTVHEAGGTLYWQNAKLYAEAEVCCRDYALNVKTRDFYYNFEIRYALSGKILLKLTGIDVSHLRSKRQITGEINTFYTSANHVWYMPGSILIGLTYNY